MTPVVNDRPVLSTEDQAQLAEIAAVTAQLAAAERLTEAIRERRDRLLLSSAGNGLAHADLAAAAEMTPQGIGKITRAAGQHRYRPRSAD